MPYYSQGIMDFSFLSVWTEMKGVTQPRCTNFQLLLHFEPPQSGKHTSGAL